MASGLYGHCSFLPRVYGTTLPQLRQISKALGHYTNFRCISLLQLHSLTNVYLVLIELILCVMQKIVLSPRRCDFIRDKMSIKEGVECSCTENRIVVPSLRDVQRAIDADQNFLELYVLFKAHFTIVSVRRS